VNVFRTTHSPKGYAERAAAAVALLACTGATLVALCRLSRSEWRANGGEWITIRRHGKCWAMPVLLPARLAVTRYLAAAPVAPGCDALFVDRDGLPCKLNLLHDQLSKFTARVGLKGLRLTGRLRAAFATAVDEADDQSTARHLVRGPARYEEVVGLARKRAVLAACHPLAAGGRGSFAHVGAIARAFPDRAFPPLSLRAQRDLTAARNVKGAPYPDELRLAILRASKSGYDRREIAVHYGVPPVYVDIVKRRHREGAALRLPRGGGLRLRSNQKLLLAMARAHPEWSAPMLVEAMREQGVVTDPYGVYHLLGVHGISLAKPAQLAAWRGDIRAAIAADLLVQNRQLVEMLKRRGVVTNESVVAREVSLMGLGRAVRNTRPGVLTQHDDDLRYWFETEPELRYDDVVKRLAAMGTATTRIAVTYAVRRLGLRRGQRPRRRGELDCYFKAVLARVRRGMSYADIVIWLAATHGVITNKINVGYLVRKRGSGVQRARRHAAGLRSNG
jgi:transposase